VREYIGCADGYGLNIGGGTFVCGGYGKGGDCTFVCGGYGLINPGCE